jgi:exopolyphosphatase/guanosine-5'-triphosphate,3'-diphosphate pyrophosphatase
VITPAGLRWLIERCLRAGHIDRLDLPGLKEDRRAVIAGGLALLYTLAAHFGIAALQPARGALRQGVIIDLHTRHAALRAPRRRERSGRLAAERDIRAASVRGLQRRFMVDAAQAARVRHVALALYRGVAGEHDDPAAAESERNLGWACDLHEIGMMVSHHDHHRHSAYLLAHVDAPGFSQSQQRRIGELVLGQRGGLRKVEPQLTSAPFAWQVLCLRLAVIKCHARGRPDPNALTLRAQGRDAVLTFSAAWAEAHPRTLFLLQEEVAAWARNGPLRLVLAET